MDSPRCSVWWLLLVDIYLPVMAIDGSLPGSFVHGIFQARVLEWVAIAFSFMWLRLKNVKKKDVCPFLLLENPRSLSPPREPQIPVSSGTPGLLIHLPRKRLSQSHGQVLRCALGHCWKWAYCPELDQAGQWRYGQVACDLGMIRDVISVWSAMWSVHDLQRD